MLGEVVIISVDFSVGKVFAEPAKNCERRSFAPVNQSLFLRFP